MNYGLLLRIELRKQKIESSEKNKITQTEYVKTDNLFFSPDEVCFETFALIPIRVNARREISSASILEKIEPEL